MSERSAGVLAQVVDAIDGEYVVSRGCRVFNVGVC
jgi:hypothetical protein